MPSSNDDRSAAAGVLSNLSGFIISASLAMLAIEGALLAFVLGDRVAGTIFFVVFSLSFLSFVFSIFCGGWGVTRTAERLAAGRWTISIGSGWFSAQAGFAFLGLLLFGASALVSGTPRETEIQKLLTELTLQTRTLQSFLEDGKRSDDKLESELVGIAEQLQRLDRRLSARIDDIESRMEASDEHSELPPK